MSLESGGNDMKNLTISTGQQGTEPSLIAINLFAREAGVSPVTLWRWRKLGWLKTVNICGRVYVTREDLQDFKRRAAAGEFAQEHKVPRILTVADCT